MADPQCFGCHVWSKTCTSCGVRVACSLRQLVELGTFLRPRTESDMRGRVGVSYATHVASAVIRDMDGR